MASLGEIGSFHGASGLQTSGDMPGKDLKRGGRQLMATVVKSMATSGVDGFMVEIEASTIRGQQQSISIIGLGD